MDEAAPSYAWASKRPRHDECEEETSDEEEDETTLGETKSTALKTEVKDPVGLLGMERDELERYFESIRTNPFELNAFRAEMNVQCEVPGDFQRAIMFARFAGAAASQLLHLHSEKVDDEAKKLQMTKLPSPSERVEDVCFFVKEQKLQHSFDLIRFIKRVEELFEWYTDGKIQKAFLGPYFAMVQSSGMGKTKLLFEFREHVMQKIISSNKSTMARPKKKAQPKQKRKPNTSVNANVDVFEECDCVTILCSNDQISEDTDEIFSESMILPQQPLLTWEQIWKMLDDILGKCRRKNVVFLFDESQHLLEFDGFYFRCVRWWLRRIRLHKRVVAVFTGTTSKLTNLYKEPPKNSGASSRDGSSKFYQSGKTPYRPFYDICTIGLFATPLWYEPAEDSGDAEVGHQGGGVVTGAASRVGRSDYEKAIPHGRPLFALMHRNGTLTDEKLSSVLDRMLLKVMWRTDWTKNLDACLSILCTRIQMGQTPVALASELVSKGYALLSDFSVPDDGDKVCSSGFARLSFPPDPVCARLAMGLMDEDWVFQGIQGQSKYFWVQTMSLIFSQGLCLPNQGNLGETGGALYLLLCGDLIRKLIGVKRNENVYTGANDYTMFSIPLEKWIACLIQPNSFVSKKKVPAFTANVTPKPLDAFDFDPVREDEFREQHYRKVKTVRGRTRLSTKGGTSTASSEPVPSRRSSSKATSSKQEASKDDLNEPGLLTRASSRSKASQRTSSNPPQPLPLLYDAAEVSFIQVVGNSIRFSTSDMTTQTFLGSVYQAACAFYVYPMCHVIDMVGSIRLTRIDNMTEHYVPLLVSISTKHDKGPQDAVLNSMETMLNEANTFGLCIRLLFARPGQLVKQMTHLLTVDDATVLRQGQTVSKVVIVPENDPFGIVKNLLETTSLGSLEGEAFSSHYFLPLGKPGTELVQTRTNNVKARQYVTDLHEALLNKGRIPNFGAYRSHPGRKRRRGYDKERGVGDEERGNEAYAP